MGELGRRGDGKQINRLVLNNGSSVPQGPLLKIGALHHVNVDPAASHSNSIFDCHPVISMEVI